MPDDTHSTTLVRPTFLEEACLPDSRREHAGLQHSARGLFHRCRRRRTRHRRERKPSNTLEFTAWSVQLNNTTLNSKFTRPVKHNVIGQPATLALHIGLTTRTCPPTRTSLQDVINSTHASQSSTTLCMVKQWRVNNNYCWHERSSGVYTKLLKSTLHVEPK